jgi:hypothetical protein
VIFMSFHALARDLMPAVRLLACNSSLAALEP